MKLSNQAIGAIMMALQNSLMEQSDITDILKDLVSTYGKTTFGDFKVNISVGLNYGEMKELCR